MKTTFNIISILVLAGTLSYAEGDRKRHGKRPNPGELLKKLDTDNSGSISKAEFMAGDRSKENPERAAKAFEMMDADGNGKITVKEIGHRRRGGGARPAPGEILEKLDTNGDGNISKEEFLAGERAQDNPEIAGQLFDKLDADGDGIVSGEEFSKGPHRGGDRPGIGRPDKQGRAAKPSLE
ncbi:MAG: EF-hand domain-containing protein [Luteolibacter sp.]